MFTQIHHIAFAVHNLKEAMERMEKDYNLHREKKITIVDREMDAVLYKIGKTRFEFLAPISDKSPLNNFLLTNGEGIHHIAYLVKNINETKEQLPEESLQPIRKSSVGNWIIADFKPEYNLIGIKSQLIQEN